MHADPIHRRRMVLHGVLKTISEQLSPDLEPEVGIAAWKSFFKARLWRDSSSEEVLRRDDWHATLLRIESWAAARGVTFGREVAA